jgi:hypothetical protein
MARAWFIAVVPACLPTATGHTQVLETRLMRVRERIELVQFNSMKFDFLYIFDSKPTGRQAVKRPSDRATGNASMKQQASFGLALIPLTICRDLQSSSAISL